MLIYHFSPPCVIIRCNIFVMTINPTKLQSANAVGTSQHFQELRLLSSNLFHASRLCSPNLQETKGCLSIIDRFWSRVRRKILFECTRNKGKLSKSKMKLIKRLLTQVPGQISILGQKGCKRHISITVAVGSPSKALCPAWQQRDDDVDDD